MAKILLEICCASVDDAVAAQQGGAQRIELCSALFLGGLTPSHGTLAEARKLLGIPIIAMIRPRGGGFCYTDAEMAVMERDVDHALELGADGIVFGILNSDGTVDVERCARICRRAGDRQVVFHRAFDVTPEPLRALDQLIDLGITRLLTSGQQNSALEGAPLIRRLIEHAQGRIEIMPGGGVHLPTIDDVIVRTGCTQVHLTAFAGQSDSSTLASPSITFGGALHPPESRYDVTDSGLVKRVAEFLAGSHAAKAGTY
jgi:copper homeostasis protein